MQSGNFIAFLFPDEVQKAIDTESKRYEKLSSGAWERFRATPRGAQGLLLALFSSDLALLRRHLWYQRFELDCGCCSNMKGKRFTSCTISPALRMTFFVFGPYLQVLRVYFWLCAPGSLLVGLGNYIGCQGLNPRWLCAKQLAPLFNCSGPS